MGVGRQLTDDGHIVTGGLKLPQGDIDGDTALTLGLELVKNPSILEGALAKFGSFLLRGQSCSSQSRQPSEMCDVIGPCAREEEERGARKKICVAEL